MTLENINNLINNGTLQEFKDVSIKQIEARLNTAISYYNFAKHALGIIKDNKVIYTNLYTAARILADAFLWLRGYRIRQGAKDRHKLLLQAVEFFMNDSRMDVVFRRLDRMRKNRNIIDYDAETLDISFQSLEQAIEDIKIFAAKVREAIRNKTI